MHAEESRAIMALVERLSQRFRDIEGKTVERVVAEERRQFDKARMRDYVPLLVEHAAVDRLDAMKPRLPERP